MFSRHVGAHRLNAPLVGRAARVVRVRGSSSALSRDETLPSAVRRGPYSGKHAGSVSGSGGGGGDTSHTCGWTEIDGGTRAAAAVDTALHRLLHLLSWSTGERACKLI